MGLLEECRRVFLVRKTAEETAAVTGGPQKLKRVLGIWDLVLIGIGANIGAGIFVLSGVAAKGYAGPAISVSFLIAGLISILVALCYAELSSMIPSAGASYSYAYVSLGELAAWIVGWVLIMNYALTCTAVAVGWSGYVGHILDEAGFTLPAELSAAPGTARGAIFNLPAFAITLVLTGILLFGIKGSAWLNRIMVVVKVSVLTVFIVLGATMVDPENLSPFAPFGFGGIMSGAAVVFFAYMGFDAHATVSEEAQDPKRNMPRAIVMALLVCTAFYMGVALVLSGLVPIDKIDTAAPLAGAFISHGVRWAASVVAVGAWFAITNVLFISLLAQPRILMSLSRDGLAPAGFAAVHRRTQIPYNATIILGLAVAVLAGLTPITQAAEMGNICALFVFALVCWMVVRLRKDRPDLPRTFRVPFVPALPLAGAGACIALMFFLHYSTWLMFIMWLGIGFIVYANYGMKRGVSSKRQKKGS